MSNISSAVYQFGENEIELPDNTENYVPEEEEESPLIIRKESEPIDIPKKNLKQAVMQNDKLRLKELFGDYRQPKSKYDVIHY